jgi:hypothetical protein
MDAYLGYRPLRARVKVTGKPAGGRSRRVAEKSAHVHVTRRGDTLAACATRVILP